MRLRTFIATPILDRIEALRVLLLRAWHFGVPGALPLTTGNTHADMQTLLAQARPAEQEVTVRLTRADALNQALNAPEIDADKRQELCLARLHALFGDTFMVLPRFTPSHATELASAFAASPAVQGGDPLAVVTWHQRAARVSAGVGRFDDVMRYAEAYNTGEVLNLQVAQLPYQPNDRWIGLPHAGAAPLPGGRLSLIAHLPQALDTAQPLTGLWLDDLLEVVPNDNETTGVVFQYDQPNSVAPQAILLAVPPDPAAPQWTAYHLNANADGNHGPDAHKQSRPRGSGGAGAVSSGHVFCLQCPKRHDFHRFSPGQRLNRREDIMPSITSWMRLEPFVKTADMHTALQARVYDPLWMLTRQWQMGEFQGEDTGSPIVAQLRGESARLTRYLPGRPPVTLQAGQPYNPRLQPLEPLIEREPVRPRPGAIAGLVQSAEAGLHFLRLAGQTYRDRLVRTYPMPTLTPQQQAQADSDSLQFLRMMTGRVPDGARMFTAWRQGTLVTAPLFTATEVPAVRRAADTWGQWYAALFSEPTDETTTAWLPERMEYSLAVAAPAGSPTVQDIDGETVLTAREYYDGHPDWYDFTLRPGASLGAQQDHVDTPTGDQPRNPMPITRTVIPAPVTFHGMPAHRWWEFEDATVDFGAIETRPTRSGPYVDD